MTGPYAQAAGDYWNAGWRGVLPLPPRRKANPPDGTTGNDGRDPSFPDVMAWTEELGDGNVALRLPDGVLGLDIDNYDTKAGAASLEAAERLWGPLPATWRSTSRDDGVSGIRLYRVPAHGDGGPLRWPGGFGPGTETIRRGHRYAVAPPSIHPEGRTYRWITPAGLVSTTPPRVGDLPWLPAAWVAGLTENRPAHSYQGAGMADDDIKAWLAEHNHGTRTCGVMAEVVDDALVEMQGGAHEALRFLMRVVGSAAVGHDGLFAALHELRTVFVTTVAPRRDGGERTAAQEWTRSLFGAVDKVVGSGEVPDEMPFDPCEVLSAPAEPSAPVDVWTGEPQPGDTAVDAGPDVELEDTPEADDQVEAALNAEQQWQAKVAQELANLRARQEAKHLLAAENAPKLQLLDAEEFLDSPTPEPMIPNFLYKDSLTRIFGAPGCGKSFLSLDLAFHVALGMDWEGKPVDQAKVIYVMAEGQRVNTARARAWLERHGVDRGDLAGWFYAVPHKVLLTEEAVGDLVGKVRELKAGLVFFDTKNAMMLGDENSASDFAVVRRAMDLVREASEASVVLIDHTGFGDPKRARGSSAGIGAMDTEVLVENDGQRPAKVTTTTTRDKGDEDGSQHEFFLRTHPLIDGTPAAVLLPIDDDTELPAPRELPTDVERRWMNAELPMPESVVDYDGPGKAAVPDLAKFMAHDAGIADPDSIGVTRVQAQSALSVTRLGKGRGHSEPAVRRAWSALRAMGYLAPADGKDGSDGKAENTTGRHVWTARGAR